MNANIKRVYPRSLQKTPIVFAHFNTDHFHEALVCNSCFAGMYFETDAFVRRNSDIQIKVIQQEPETISAGAYRFYRANVKWCKDISQSDSPRFGAGVKYTVKSHLVDGPVYQCGLCGEIFPAGKIHQVEEFVYLCSDCFKHFKQLPDGKLKEIAGDFMIGNVL
jgi:hypothetical protein